MTAIESFFSVSAKRVCLIVFTEHTVALNIENVLLKMLPQGLEGFQNQSKLCNVTSLTDDRLESES